MYGLVVNEARLGYDHVTAQEQATTNMSLLGGTGNYLDPYYGNKCTMTMVSANSLQISTGAMWVNGHNIQITSPITVPIANGQVGLKRKDLICVHLDTAGFGTVDAIDYFDIVAIQGTPSTGTPSDPTLAVDHITHDVQESWSVIGRVTIDGLTPTAELLLQTLPALLITPDRIEPHSIGKDQLETTVWDSIYQYHELATNCDDLTENGIYSVRPGSPGLPLSGAWVNVIVIKANNSSQYVSQLAVSTERDMHVYVRCLFNGSWTAWRTLAFV